MSDLGNREIFSKNLQYYMNLYNKTRIQVAKDIGVSYTTFTSWIKGTNYPRIDKIELLANYFRVNKADLIENKYSENEQYYNDPSVSEYAQAIKDNPDLRLLFDASKDMSKDDINFVINTIEMLKKREGKQYGIIIIFCFYYRLLCRLPYYGWYHRFNRIDCVCLVLFQARKAVCGYTSMVSYCGIIQYIFN